VDLKGLKTRMEWKPTTTKENTMKKRLIVKLPLTIDMDPKTKACSIEFGKVPPIVFKDGTKIRLQFPSTGKYKP
jgi:hypothetical protein